MKNITKGLAALLTTVALGIGLGYTQPVAANGFTPKVQINSNLTRVQISSDEFALREGYMTDSLEIMQRIRELAVTGANGIYNQDDMI